MTRSLLDTANLPALRDLARGGPAPAIAAALIDSGLLQFDPDDPTWADRDRLVVGGESVVTALRHRLEAAGAPLEPTAHVAGPAATAVALGAAVASSLRGGIWRTWCVLDEGACDEGRTWEGARAAAEAEVRALTALVAGVGSLKLWQACGWKTQTVPAEDPAWLLGALDHALTDGPTAVVVHD